MLAARLGLWESQDDGSPASGWGWNCPAIMPEYELLMFFHVVDFDRMMCDIFASYIMIVARRCGPNNVFVAFSSLQLL